MIDAVHNALGWMFWPYCAALGINCFVIAVFSMETQENLRSDRRWMVFFAPLIWVFPEETLTKKGQRYLVKSVIALGFLMALIMGGLLASAK
jgi:hypothetical protein